MKFIDLIKLATRMFKARTSRMILTILGIGIGMATILFLISLGFGIQKIVLSKITTPESLLSIDVNGFLSGDENLSAVDLKKIRNIKGVEEVAGLNKQKGQIEIGEYFSSGNVLLVQPGYIEMNGKRIIKGETIKEDNLSGAVISSTFLKVLGDEPENLLGQDIGIVLLNDSEGKLDVANKDRLDLKMKIIGIAEDDKSNIYVHLDNFDSNEVLAYSLVKVRTYSEEQIERVKNGLNELGYRTSSVSEIVDQTKKFFSILSFILTILGVVALFVSSIGMFNTMIISLLERTEEIGVMKAIGAKDRDILNIFVVESGLIGFLGGLAGVVIGFSAQVIFSLFFNFIAVQMGGNKLELFLTPWWFVFSLIGMSLVIGILTGWIPARRASRVDPLEALKD
jgi:putative ABC transport system permease protein